MTISYTDLKESIDKAYRLIKPKRADLDVFKASLLNLISHIDEKESEENVKIHLADFLKNTFFHPDYLVATKGRADLVIHLGKDSKAPAGVLFEVKKPTNKSDMISKDNLNTKAMHELILYFLRERINNKNNSLTHLIITNIYEWYVFDAAHFDKIFAQNKELHKSYIEWDNGQKISSNTDLFYKEIAKPFLVELTKVVSFTHFDIRDYNKSLKNDLGREDRKLIALYKFFTPIHLLKLPFINDSNSLNKGFFNELLHIIGLEEVKDGSRKIIRRLPEGKRYSGSLIENTINILEVEDSVRKVPGIASYGASKEEQLFTLSLELSITWVNRILFLKLLEAQLIKYHNGNKHYRFLNNVTIRDYDELYKLFFQVLAKQSSERNPLVTEKYSHIPYLNSSLFEISELEDRTIKINGLDDNLDIEIYAGSVLKKNSSKKGMTMMNTLHYFLEFLDAYDFASVGKEEIQEENKTIINASVLGLVFEKINGYKDGSIYTPGAITMFLCKETITKAVLKKFNDVYNWQCLTLDDLSNHLSDRRNASDILEFNAVIDSIKIVDPAVGSGHFLVSSLNELISIKSVIGILADEFGRRLSDIDISIANDELVVTDRKSNNFFEYIITEQNSRRVISPDVQKIQQTLFNEKRKIIEGCLFGVDINPNSVKICRLRLWIELLKHAYYRNEENFSELETLPNIDINIKHGNSLLSKYSLTEDLSEVFKKHKFGIKDYQQAVAAYKEAPNKDAKADLLTFIRSIKEQFHETVSRRDPRRKKMSELRGLLALAQDNNDLFGKKRSVKDTKKTVEKLSLALEKLDKEVKEIESNILYRNAFEWRFEFPEVLNEKGDFEGFEVIIGNPPYIQLQKMGAEADVLEKGNFKTFVRTGDIYSLFYEQATRLLKPDYFFGYITSSKWMRANYGLETRQFFIDETNPLLLIDFGGFQVFESATVDTNILIAQKSPNVGSTQTCLLGRDLPSLEKMSVFVKQHSVMFNFSNPESWVLLAPIEQEINAKIKKIGVPLKQWDININRGVLTGFNQAFIIDGETKSRLIDSDPKTVDIIRPILRGRDIKRFGYDFADLWLINIHNGIKEKGVKAVNVENYPGIKDHLDQFYSQLQNRSDKGDTPYNLRNCAYMEDFSKQKIVWGEISDTTKFAMDVRGEFVTEATTFLLTGNSLYFLLGFLNSKLSSYLFSYIGTTTGVGTIRWKKFTIEQLRVPILSVEQKETLNTVVAQIIERQQRKEPFIDLEAEVDNIIYTAFGLSPDEIAFIESR